MRIGMNLRPEATRKAVPWRDNSSLMGTLYAILTAMVGAILAFAIMDPKIEKNGNWHWPVGLLAFSMVAFISGVEKCADAIDEDDVDKYLAWLLAYNLGTITMFFGLATHIGLHFWPDSNRPGNLEGWPLLGTLLGLAAAGSWKWGKDIGFLLFKNEAEYEAYREELLGCRKPEKESDFLMRLHGLIRRSRGEAKKGRLLPDTESFTRLMPSRIHGIGVFAIRDIPNGTNVFKDDQSEMVWIDRTEVQKKTGEIKRLYDDFCVERDGRYGCPNGFNNLTVAWYINEPPEGSEPSVRCGDEYDFFAARDIKAGEELTVDYSTFSDRPNTPELSA